MSYKGIAARLGVSKRPVARAMKKYREEGNG